MSDAPALRPDPSAALEAAYRRVQGTRMAGLPFLNDRLGVEAVGFAPWKAHWLGVVVTPWFMNLVVTPRDAAQWRSLPPGEKRRYRFPAGDYDFISASEDGVGEFFMCSLFSPVTEFDDQATARFVAQHALAALLDPANDERAKQAQPEAADAAPGPIAQMGEALERPLSRRDVLRGRFLAKADEPRR
jgi:[NiFe] hydrogenase assembly HybE family chaperone